MLDETAPVAVTAVGSRRLIHDDADIPDTMEAIFEMPSGVIVKFSIHEACSGELFRGDVELRGSDGNVVVDEGGYRIWRPEPGQFQKWQKVADEEPVMLSQLAGESAVRDSTVYMVRNFIDCIRSREVPYCSLEEGHRSTSFAHLANIALKRERRLIWDGEAERFTNDDAANALLVYQYRSPWTLDM